VKKIRITMELTMDQLAHVLSLGAKVEGLPTAPPAKSAPAPAAVQPAHDPLWENAVALLAELPYVSTSLLQRRLFIGYPRAARIIDEMERQGLVGPQHGPEPRQILAKKPVEAADPEMLKNVARQYDGSKASVQKIARNLKMSETQVRAVLKNILNDKVKA
jgi:hypothetical protein